MSFPAFRWAAELLPDCSLPPTERLVLLVLADLANKGNVAWPSYAKLSRHVGLSERRCQQAISHLLDVGLIERVWRTGTRGRQTSNMYRLLLSASLSKPVDNPVDNFCEGRNIQHRNSETGVSKFSPLDPTEPLANRGSTAMSDVDKSEGTNEPASLPARSYAAPKGADSSRKEVRQVDKAVGRQALQQAKAILGQPT